MVRRAALVPSGIIATKKERVANDIFCLFDRFDRRFFLVRVGNSWSLLFSICEFSMLV